MILIIIITIIIIIIIIIFIIIIIIIIIVIIIIIIIIIISKPNHLWSTGGNETMVMQLLTDEVMSQLKQKHPNQPN